MYILYQLILFNKVRMLKADIFEIVCVCFHVLICLLSFFFRFKTRNDQIVENRCGYTRRRTDVLAWRGSISLNEEVVYITLFRSNVYGIIFSCQTLQVEKLKQHLMLICANKVWSCVQGLIICFRS